MNKVQIHLGMTNIITMAIGCFFMGKEYVVIMLGFAIIGLENERDVFLTTCDVFLKGISCCFSLCCDMSNQ